MFRILVMKLLLISLILIWTSAAREPSAGTLIKSSAELPTGPLNYSASKPLVFLNETLMEKRRPKTLCSLELSGVCVKKKKSCPSHLPSQKSPGKPYCSKKYRCCYPDVKWSGIRNACIKSNNYKTYTTSTIDLCKEKCVEEEDINCQSIEYSSEQQMCSISEARSDSGDFTEPCFVDGWVFAERELDEDNKECEVNNGGCDHICTETIGSYICSCQEGYTLDDDQITCIDVNWSGIRNACIKSNNYKTYTTSTIDLCKEKCVEEEEINCQSIEYSSEQQMCSISEARSDSDDFTEPCFVDGWVFAERELNESTPSCNLVWNYKEERPLIMIRISTTIVPPVIDMDVSDDPNRIPVGRKLIFACPGDNNHFNNFPGTHTKLHGECISHEQFKVCFNNNPVILDLSRLSCSRKMHPSFIKDNATSDKNSCDGIGGEPYKTGYTYGDNHEFKDLEIEVCFREKNQTTLCTSPNLNGNITDYRTARGFKELPGRDPRMPEKPCGSNGTDCDVIFTTNNRVRPPKCQAAINRLFNQQIFDLWKSIGQQNIGSKIQIEKKKFDLQNQLFTENELTILRTYTDNSMDPILDKWFAKNYDISVERPFFFEELQSLQTTQNPSTDLLTDNLLLHSFYGNGNKKKHKFTGCHDFSVFLDKEGHILKSGTVTDFYPYGPGGIIYFTDSEVDWRGNKEDTFIKKKPTSMFIGVPAYVQASLYVSALNEVKTCDRDYEVTLPDQENKEFKIKIAVKCYNGKVGTVFPKVSKN